MDRHTWAPGKSCSLVRVVDHRFSGPPGGKQLNSMKSLLDFGSGPGIGLVSSVGAIVVCVQFLYAIYYLSMTTCRPSLTKNDCRQRSMMGSDCGRVKFGRRRTYLVRVQLCLLVTPKLELPFIYPTILALPPTFDFHKQINKSVLHISSPNQQVVSIPTIRSTFSHGPITSVHESPSQSICNVISQVDISTGGEHLQEPVCFSVANVEEVLSSNTTFVSFTRDSFWCGVKCISYVDWYSYNERGILTCSVSSLNLLQRQPWKNIKKKIMTL